MDEEARDAFDVTGRVAVVTGGAGGIGSHVARMLAGSGAIVVIGDLAGPRLDSVASGIVASGGQATAVPTDVRQRDEVSALAESAVHSHGRLDIWVNLAGAIRRTPFLETSEAEFDDLVAINVKGVYFGCQSASTIFASRHGGSIVNLTSMAADRPSPNLSVYALTKAAVAMLTKDVAEELGPSGIRVNAVAPGFIPTQMTAYRWLNDDGSIDEARRQSALQAMAAGTPLGRNGATLDIALAVLYLASDASKFITGQTLHVNGGEWMP